MMAIISTLWRFFLDLSLRHCRTSELYSIIIPFCQKVYTKVECSSRSDFRLGRIGDIAINDKGGEKGHDGRLRAAGSCFGRKPRG